MASLAYRRGCLCMRPRNWGRARKGVLQAHKRRNGEVEDSWKKRFSQKFSQDDRGAGRRCSGCGKRDWRFDGLGRRR